MTEDEIERFLREPGAVERLRKAAERIGIATGSLGQSAEPGGSAVRAESPPNLVLPSLEEIAAQDLSVSSLPKVLGLDNYLPELEEKNPVESVDYLAARFGADPSASNAQLLQAAINRVTSAGPLNETAREVVSRAMDLFHAEAGKRPGKSQAGKRPGKSDDVWYWAYVDADFGGASFWDDLTPGWVYWRRPDLRTIGMNDVVSSLVYGCNANEAGGNVILFENINYNGRYLNYSTQPGYSKGISYVPDNFNDITSSTLIVRRFANETQPVQIGNQALQNQIASIIAKQSGVSWDGNATITWDMWPTGPTSGTDPHPNDPGKTFIYVIVPLIAQTPWDYPNYYVQARYWIYVYVDGSGKLQGYVDWIGCYVESGLIHNEVHDSLMAKIPGTVGPVNAVVADILAIANTSGPYRFSYFLPGNNQFTGNTAENITVVAVRS